MDVVETLREIATTKAVGGTSPTETEQAVGTAGAMQPYVSHPAAPFLPAAVDLDGGIPPLGFDAADPVALCGRRKQRPVVLSEAPSGSRGTWPHERPLGTDAFFLLHALVRSASSAPHRAAARRAARRADIPPLLKVWVPCSDGVGWRADETC